MAFRIMNFSGRIINADNGVSFMNMKSILTEGIPDSVYIWIQYVHHFHRFPNLNNPKTFNEKLQWLKLHDHNPTYTTMVDKVKVKEYVASRIGEEYIIPTLGIWERAEDVDFDSLPEQFVIKCNHDSHGVIVCKDKSKLNVENTRYSLGKRLNNNGYSYGREWPYKNVERRILAEQFIKDESGELIDYKIHCFNGEPKFVLICQDRFSKTGLKEDFYDLSWKIIDVKRPNIEHGTPISKPAAIDRMLTLSRILSKDVPFLRVDFYYTQGKILFGELTLFPASGFQRFVPESYDRLFGDWIRLPKK